MPAAMLVTHEMASTSMPHVAGGDDLRNGGHTYQVSSDGPQITNFSRRLVAWAEHSRIDSLKDSTAQSAGFIKDKLAKLGAVAIRHVGKTRTKTIVVGTDKGILSLKIDVIANRQLTRPGRKQD